MLLPLDTFLSIIASASTAAGPLLGLFIYALFKGWIVLGSTFRKAALEGEQWKAMSLRLLGVAEGSLKQTRRQTVPQPKLPALAEGTKDDEQDARDT